MNKISDVILRNSRSEQYLCAARKNFIEADGVLSESASKTVFCHFSDLHGDWERYDNVLDMINYFKPLFAVHTGDLVCWDSNDGYDYFRYKAKNVETPIYNCIGNHETFRGNEVLSNEFLHERYIKPLKDIHSEDRGYYYVDFEEQNLRLVVLNDYENDGWEVHWDRGYEILQKQCDWLCGVLKECEQKKLGVIIASHECDEPIVPGSNDIGFCQRTEPYPWGHPTPHCHIVADIVDAFKNAKKLEKSYKWEKSGNTVEVLCSFEEKNEFICYLNGHRHGDYAGYLPSYPDQLSLGMTCSGCFPAGYHNIGDEISDLPRIPGTLSEDAVNMCVLDREKRTVSVVRFGAYVNDRFEERIAAKFNY